MSAAAIETGAVVVTRASIADVGRIVCLLFGAMPHCRPRTASQIARELDDYIVAREAPGGPAIGAVALNRLDGKDAELRSLVVDRDHRGRGVAGDLIRAVIRRARRRGLELFCVTRHPAVFASYGFRPLPVRGEPATEDGCSGRVCMRHQLDRALAATVGVARGSEEDVKCTRTA